MTPAEAIARIEEINGTPTTQERVWDSLTNQQRAAIMALAGVNQSATTFRNIHPESFARCWSTLEKFAGLCLKITAANDRLRAEIYAELCTVREAA